MTRHYLAGQLSVVLGHLQAVAATEAAVQEAWTLRLAVETQPVATLGSAIIRALALAERLCWDSLNSGDVAAFSRQATVCAELRDFGVFAGLLIDG